MASVPSLLFALRHPVGRTGLGGPVLHRRRGVRAGRLSERHRRRAVERPCLGDNSLGQLGSGGRPTPALPSESGRAPVGVGLMVSVSPSQGGGVVLSNPTAIMAPMIGLR